MDRGARSVAGGGEAHVCEAEFPDAADRRRPRRALPAVTRDADYAALPASSRPARGAARGARSRGSAALVARARRRFDQIARMDFFDAGGRKSREARLSELEDSRAIPRTAGEDCRPLAARRAGRTWTTRRGIKVDRIASAWLIRRFLDAEGAIPVRRSRRTRAPKGEIRFDMVGGDFTHEGGGCTFETLARPHTG